MGQAKFDERRSVIAHLSRIGTSFTSSLILLVCVLLITNFLRNASDAFGNGLALNFDNKLLLAFFGVIVALLLLMQQAAVLFQFAFRGRRAIWFEDDELCICPLYLGIVVRRMKRRDITQILLRPGSLLRPRSIIICESDREPYLVPAWFLTESAPEVIRQLSLGRR